MELPAAAAWVVRGGLGLLVATACVSDTRSRRIPNWVAAAGLIGALLWHGLSPRGKGLFDPTEAGGLGIASALAGGALLFAVFLCLYLLRAMGAGDVKLATMLGAWFGFDAAPLFTLSVFVCGGLVALARLAFGVSSRRVASNLRLILSGRGLRSPFAQANDDPRPSTADRMPYAWAISIGAAVLAVRQYAG